MLVFTSNCFRKCYYIWNNQVIELEIVTSKNQKSKKSLTLLAFICLNSATKSRIDVCQQNAFFPSDDRFNGCYERFYHQKSLSTVGQREHYPDDDVCRTWLYSTKQRINKSRAISQRAKMQSTKYTANRPQLFGLKISHGSLTGKIKLSKHNLSARIKKNRRRIKLAIYEECSSQNQYFILLQFGWKLFPRSPADKCWIFGSATFCNYFI